ncbi:MAG: alanine--glyoxylate aminotransferase family protein [Anaerolineae bacterium]|nr:MAG: alanine--glyoxylate aminotransferase family protein [Anaerolineae bacterium]
MIPGPIEFDPAVMEAMGAATTSHVAPEFIEVFGQALERMRQAWLAPGGQPFVVAGSGTLAMDMAAANLIEPGDRALVINTGYFGDRMAAILARYGAEVDHVRAPVGDRPSAEEVEAALGQANYKVMAITHVDTSTAVLADVENWAKLSCQWETLTIVDGVCSVAGEELRQQEWCVDVALTASQKAVGVPPGLALLVVGPRAMETFRRRRRPVANYYADWNSWLPVMEAYEARRPSYFGTPAVNLVAALNVSLGQILAEGLEARFERHRRMSRAVKAAVSALGLGQVPVRDEVAAHTLTAPRYPDGVDSNLLGHVKAAGAILAGGLHPEIRGEYFRIGHMGVTSFGDVLATIGALEQGLMAVGYDFEPGAGLAAAQALLLD